MLSVLAIDPGINITGVALFENGMLIAADAVKNKSKSEDIAKRCLDMAEAVIIWLIAHKISIDLLVLEWPQIYPKSKGDPNDLPHLAGIGMAIAGAIAVSKAAAQGVLQVKTFKPREWKGNLPKGPVYDSRVLSKLEFECEERGVFTELKDHNAKDAVGIGLKALGRF